MSTRARLKTDEAAGAADVSRKPLQGRSKATLERMLAAARDIMLERGNEDFTLQEVGERGKVSIGSIYLRFESKDNLIRRVIADALASMSAEEAAMFARLRNCRNLTEFVVRYIDEYTAVLSNHAPILRLTLERAARDELVSVPGKQHAMRAERTCMDALLVHAAEFGGTRHSVKARSVYNLIYSTLFRQLSLGLVDETSHNYDWNELKGELAEMCLAYLAKA